MKYVVRIIFPVFILIVIFVVISRKDFFFRDSGGQRNDEEGKTIATDKVSETTSSYVAHVDSVATNIAPEKNIELGLQTDRQTDRDNNSTVNQGLTEAETRSLTETDPEAFTPIAISVVTAEEAERLNSEAQGHYEKHAKQWEFLKEGMNLTLDSKIDKYSKVSIPNNVDELFEKNGVVHKDEIRRKMIPQKWLVDFNTIKGECLFEETDHGFHVYSPDSFLNVQLPLQTVSNKTIGISILYSSASKETHIKAGMEDYGLYRPGKVYFTEISGMHDEECINMEVSVLDHFDRIRPFLEISGDATIHQVRFFQKEAEQLTYVCGEIKDRSILPDPAKSDYPNCRFTAHFHGHSILSGETTPREMVFLVDGFIENKVLGTNKLKVGDKIECCVIPFENLTETDQSVQQADDLNMFLLENYYVFTIHKVDVFTDDSFAPVSGVYFSEGREKYTSLFERKINPPIPQEQTEKQNNSIQNDIKKMNDLISGYDDEKINKLNSFFSEIWEKEKAKDSPLRNRIHADGNTYVWREKNNSFWCLPVEYDSFPLQTTVLDVLTAKTLDCFTALKKACEANGVQFILSLVPDSYVISSRVINEEIKNIPDIQSAMYTRQLSLAGIETIYASDAILQNFDRYPFAFFYPNDSHPSDTAQDIITDILAERLRNYGIKPVLSPALFSVEQGQHVYYDRDINLFPGNCDIGNNKAGSNYTCRRVFYNGKRVPSTKNAPIMVISNSFQNTPTASADMPSLLSYKTLSPVDYYQISGYGPFSDILYQIVSRPDFFFKDKKFLIMHVGAIHLQAINKSENMLNLALLDSERCYLDDKKRISEYEHITLSPQLQDGISDAGNTSANTKMWGALAGIDKTVFRITNNGGLIQTLQIDGNDIDESKPIICVIASTCASNMSCTLSVNDQSNPIHCSNFPENSKFFNTFFELPAGTKEITIKAEGKNGTFFAIKDIQIWQ